MLIPFDKMPDYARVWVYQADRILNKEEINAIQLALNEYISHWAAHGAPLAGAFEIVQNKFVIIAADEQLNATSGCSIDASTNWLKQIGAQLNLSFFDRSLVYFQNNEVKTADLLQIKTKVTEGEINADTLIFNTLVANIAEYKSNFQMKAIECWVKKYFKQELV